MLNDIFVGEDKLPVLYYGPIGKKNWVVEVQNFSGQLLTRPYSGIAQRESQNKIISNVCTGVELYYPDSGLPVFLPKLKIAFIPFSSFPLDFFFQAWRRMMIASCLKFFHFRPLPTYLESTLAAFDLKAIERFERLLTLDERTNFSEEKSIRNVWSGSKDKIISEIEKNHDQIMNSVPDRLEQCLGILFKHNIEIPKWAFQHEIEVGNLDFIPIPQEVSY